MSLVDARYELERRLSGIEGLRVYPLPPQSVPELPAAIIQPGQPLAEYNRTLGGGVTYNLAVLVLAGSGDEDQAWQELAAYVAPAGPRSVRAAVEAAVSADGQAEEDAAEEGTGSGVDWFRVGQAEGGGRTLYNKAACWGVTFQVQAYAAG